ncbi:tripartite tricarboxylate transporter TctB family protein [Paracoccus tegillarcae]|uniref:DUF1468 domain-containing protein n=1 Tax=Paracoccus tegillarcae TaxID=1529068 RepID=A0A2K9EDE9_9RHOB|nr:tripartite tricarboxylate transporter TctB family protein [Paracoccus tegillarcae]AUH32978.1 hypothetical protein CUV01_05835 [Paracoccus tegillarcae]
MRLGDSALGMLVLLGGAALFWAALGFSPIPGQEYGAQTMPKTIAVLAMAVGAVMMVSGRGQPALVLDGWTRDPMAWARLAASILLILGYVLFASKLGFALTAFLLLVAMMLLTGTHPLTALLVAVGAVVIVQYSFGQLLRVPLPRGDLLALPF